MNIKQFLKWSLALLAFFAYKQLEAATPGITISDGVSVVAQVQETAGTNE